MQIYIGMKTFSNWLKKGFNGISVLLIILIIPLYIIYFGKYINDKTVDILIAVAAIVSTCFLYLAFRESKKSNDLKISDVEYQYLDRLITEQESKANQCIYSIDDINNICAGFNIRPRTLKEITFSDFVYGINMVFRVIQTQEIYKKAMERLDGKLMATVPDDIIADDTLRFSSACSRVREAITEKILYNFVELFSLYKQVDSSSLIYFHKVLLINRLNSISTDYSDFNKTDRDEETEDRISFLMKFQMFAYVDKNLLFQIHNGFLPENFGQNINFEDIKIKYSN